jgi:hypothetical protein
MPDDSQRIALEYLRSEVDRLIRKAVETDDWGAKATYIRIAVQHCDSVFQIEKGFEQGFKPSN